MYKFIKLLMISTALAVLMPGRAHAGRMKILTTTNYIASLAKTIGGDKVSVDALSPPGFDADNYSARPQDLFKIHQARLFIMVGLNLEEWARDLVNAANNPNLLKAEIYHGVPLLDVPKGHVDYSFGDIHPYGNPHFQLNPEDGRIMARNIYEAMAAADPENKSFYSKNLEDFENRLIQAEKLWRSEMAPYKGMTFIPYHESWDYFAEAFGLMIPEPPKTIEEKPGFVPSPRRIQDVVRLAKDKGVKLIITEPYYNVSIAKEVAKQLSVPYLSISLYDIYLNPQEKDYISMLDHIVGQFVQTLGGRNGN